MKVITLRNVIKNVPDKWHQQYSRGNLPPHISGVEQMLRQLDLEVATEGQITAIIGNDSWTRMTCNECEKRVDWLIELGEPPDYESSTCLLCKECLVAAYKMI